jgi:LPS export ABC transporter protein LptC
VNRARGRTPLVLLLILLAACGGNGPAASPSSSPNAGTSPTPVPLHVTSSGNGEYTTLTEMKRGRRLYTIRATSFVADTTDGDGGNGSFDAPQITFVDRSGGSTVATAPKAVLTGADKSVLMTGGVRARSQDGNVLHCDRLRYDGKSERVHGDGHVRLETPSGFVLVGDTIDGDARLRDVTVRQSP